MISYIKSALSRALLFRTYAKCFEKKKNIAYLLINTCAYHMVVGDVGFPENFAYVLNRSSPTRDGNLL